MKKIVKLFSLVMLVCAVSLCFGGCGEKPKTFSNAAGISITLDSSFVEKTIVSQTMYLESQKSLFIALKEEFSLFTNIGYTPNNMSTKDYAEIVQNTNQITSEISDDATHGYSYFEYEKTASGNNYYYLAVTFKGTDAFWLCQFACFKSQKDNFTAKFFDWANTIVIA